MEPANADFIWCEYRSFPTLGVGEQAAPESVVKFAELGVAGIRGADGLVTSGSPLPMKTWALFGCFTEAVARLSATISSCVLVSLARARFPSSVHSRPSS
jgi:hypothetical protein